MHRFYFTTDRCARGQTVRNWQARVRWLQIGMAPLGLFPVTYLAPSDVGPTPTRKPSAASNSRSQMLATDGKDLPGEMISSPLNQVYYTGEVGFVYGQWSGKGNGDYWQNYVWGQAGNDQIPDQCRRFVRELERKLTENSRVSFFEIAARSGPQSSERGGSSCPQDDDVFRSREGPDV